MFVRVTVPGLTFDELQARTGTKLRMGEPYNNTNSVASASAA